MPVCCELNRPAGPLDILYVTKQGKLVITEVKLWRNPEARRKVVAQIIDYAKELNNWDYEDLQREISRKAEQKGNVLYKLAKERWSDLEESAFVDSVSRSLKKGDFLLLIIGDGIQEGTENIADFMNNVSQLQFTLGLIEIAIYKVPNEGLIVQPRVLAKTVIIERTVIDLVSAEIQVSDPNEEDEVEQEISDIKKYYTKFWSDYISQLQLDDVGIPHSTATAENLYLYPGANKQSWISAYVAKSMQQVGVYFRAPKGEYGELIYQHLLKYQDQIKNVIGEGAVWNDKGEGREKFISINLSVDDVHSERNREAIFSFYNENINNYVNALRPLLKDFEP